MTTINQLLSLIEMSGLTGSAQVALRVGETIVSMESCSFHEMPDGTALLVQGGRKGPSLETISAQHDETGRMWEGPRDQLPPGYSAVKRNDGITVTDLRGVDPKPPY